jgi:hypothetical protein
MKIVKVGDSYRRSFQGGPRHVLLGLVPGILDPAATPVIALPRAGNCDHGSLDTTRIRSEVANALSDFSGDTGRRIGLAVIEYVPNDSPYYEMYYGHALAIAHAIADDLGAPAPEMNSERPKFKQFEAVRLLVPRPDLGLAAGAHGVVVDVYVLPCVGYEVEFLDSTGHTLAIASMMPHDLTSPPISG